MITTIKRGVCWANTASECEGKMTREHIISKSILERGWLRFDAPEGKRIGINAFTASILCRKHNNSLSPIDTAAARFFKGLRAIHGDHYYDKFSERTSEGQLIVRANGAMIEKWFAKTFINMIASPLNYPEESGPLFVRHEQDIARFVFDSHTLPKPFGLWAPFGKGEEGEHVVLQTPLPAFSIQLLKWSGVKLIDSEGNLKQDNLVTPMGLCVKTGIYSFYGIFNLSMLTDEDFISHVSNCEGTKFLSKSDIFYRPTKFGFSLPHDVWRGQGPSRMIEFLW